jgi:hypothetical protein
MVTESPARSTDHQAPNLRDEYFGVRFADQRRRLEESHCRFELTPEHLRSGLPVLVPPALDRFDLGVGCLGEADPISPHLWRSFAKTSSAGITSPR